MQHRQAQFSVMVYGMMIGLVLLALGGCQERTPGAAVAIVNCEWQILNCERGKANDAIR